MWEKKPEEVVAAVQANRVGAVPPPNLGALASDDAPAAPAKAASSQSETAMALDGDSAPPPSAGGGDALAQQMAAMVGIVQRLSVSFEEVKKELAVVKGQVTGKDQAIAQTERLEGLKEGLMLTDGAVTAMVVVVNDAGARLAFPGNPDSVPIPHRTIARHWRVADSAAPKVRLDASATFRQPGVSLEEARPTARTDQRPTFDAADIRAVVHDGATWPDHADEEPGFPQLLITELERRAPEQIPASTAYQQLVALTRMVLEGRDDSAVLTRTAEYLEYWRVRERLGYQAADAYAEALDGPDELPQRARFQRQHGSEKRQQQQRYQQQWLQQEAERRPQVSTTAALALSRTVDVKRQASLEHSFFLIRNGHELGRAIAAGIPPEEAHLFASGPRNAGEADRLLTQFQAFRGAETPETPIDLSLVRFAWSRLGPAQPSTVRNYLSRLMTALADRGVRGVRTRRVQQASQTLKRLSVMIRPDQALPLKTVEAKEVVARLESKGHHQEAAMVAAVWLTRGRVPDLRVVTADDVAEVENPGASPERVGLQIFLKEKQAKSYNAPEYLPPGELTARGARRPGRYMMRTAPGDIQLKPKQLAPLQ
ncbi:hypothetical protein DIPPA_10925 [Diplonema papillatum]|nr:hypothetical protein DIPPA_10925 [Diplonema papillatum]